MYERMRQRYASTKIQKVWRMCIARRAYKRQCLSALHIQAGMRHMTARNVFHFRKQTKAAIVIQVSFIIMID